MNADRLNPDRLNADRSQGLHSLAHSMGWRGRRGSIRTQLIAWNIVALAVLLGALGVFTRVYVRQSMMIAVDKDLENRVKPPPPPRHDGHGRPPDAMPGPDDRNFPPEGQGGPQGPQPPPEGQGSQVQQPPPEAWSGPQGPQGQQPPPDRQGGPGPQGEPGVFPGSADGDGDPGAPLLRRPWQPHHGGPMDNDPYHPRFYDRDGNALDRSQDLTPWDPTGLKRALAGHIDPATTVTRDNEEIRVLTRPVIRSGQVMAAVQAAYPLTEVNNALGNLNSALLALIPVGLLFAGMGGAFLTDRVLRRVRRLTQVAELIGARTFSERLPVSGNDEFSELAHTFNGLLGRLETAYQEQQRLLEQQRRFTADASHELKTPLTVIKGNTSIALDTRPTEEEYQQTLREIDRATDTMSHLVQDLLLLARSDGGQMGRDRIELLVREILERAVSAVAYRKGAPVTLQIEDDTLTVPGNEGELVRLFTNLLDNATRYTLPDGRIVIRAARKGARVVVEVADTGTGIAPEHLPHLGERFYRADASRSRPSGGTGLGLSICKSIVEAHRGTLSFQSQVGVGTTVTVTLPAGS